MQEETAPKSSIKIPNYLADFAVSAADSLLAVVPRLRPTRQAIAATKIISHRGQRDDINVFENTFEAFDPLIDSKVYGIEFDIRWTKDLVPVVAHDANLKRLFDDDTVIAEVTFNDLRAAQPEIACLAEFINRYAERFFLTIELKQENWIEFDTQQQILVDILSRLTPVEDYIVMSFDTELLQRLDQIGNHCKLGIAHSNVPDVSKIALDNGWAGIGGHYLMISNAVIKRHKAAGQKIAIGFPTSKYSAYREVRRGTDWLFCDDALQVCDWLD